MNGIKAPIGTGPWILQESKLNQYDVFVRNENYWGEKPAIKKITFNVIPDPTTRAVAFETGDIDLLYGNEGLLPLDTFARFSQNPAYHTQLSQPIETVMLALNTAKAPTNELAVREALNYAVNRASTIRRKRKRCWKKPVGRCLRAKTSARKMVSRCALNCRSSAPMR
ncbi:nickel ABC transporter [Klebsiella pneumoniae]|nr:nickel ABC transporter [Klebsiella pneumoniae]